ncbi:MAG: M42 family metallopeptidase [Candidatus Wallbacteria bacterium]|nr:M42 family metallopeptidase [Candidatus Wallbacteria bacterium]
MHKDSLKFLEALHLASSPTGSEIPAKKVFREYLKNYADRFESDTIGNTIAVLSGSKPKGSILLAGHIDEVGVMVKYIDEKGFIFFSAVGGIDPAVLPGKRVVFEKNGKKIVGVLGKKPIHLLDAKDRDKAVQMEDLFIDIGCNSKKEAAKLLELGDTGVTSYGLEYLPNDLAVARGFDDRIGAFIIAETLKNLSSHKKNLAYTVYATATTQEEIGLRGASVCAFNLKPDLAIALDVTHAIDYPNVEKKKFGDINLGKGGVIPKGPNIHPWIYTNLVSVAKKSKIPYQVNALPRPAGNDSNVIQITRGGIPVGVVAIPLRYMHTPSEVLSLKDVENIIRLLTDFILGLKEKVNFNW